MSHAVGVTLRMSGVGWGGVGCGAPPPPATAPARRIPSSGKRILFVLVLFNIVFLSPRHELNAERMTYIMKKSFLGGCHPSLMTANLGWFRRSATFVESGCETAAADTRWALSREHEAKWSGCVHFQWGPKRRRSVTSNTGRRFQAVSQWNVCILMKKKNLIELLFFFFF